ncbi:MAG: FAD-binding oxidoreductase [Rhodobacteraceae bacterium]|nr:FAD-binding oxidoreductase [Paracoccaceae bacterium]
MAPINLNPADKAFEARLRFCLPKVALRPLTSAYLEEPRGLFHGVGGLLAAPGSVEEVSTLIKACADARVGVVPYGGGTGLVGGQVMAGGPAPVILSLERMRAIREVFPSENIMIAEAGAVLADVQNAAEVAARLFPLSLASEGSARIGGLLSTNAGGVNVLRYGNARDLCLGLEAVLPDGSIWHGLKRLRKDNTGYDLRGLLVGAEGTLGVITAASLRLFARPAEVGTALMVVPDPAAALALFSLINSQLSAGVSAFELISGAGMEFLAETGCPARAPFDEIPDWAVLIELGLGPEQNADTMLEKLFETGALAGLVSDGVVAHSGPQRAALWAMREEIPEANKRLGSLSSHDISLPLSVIPEFTQRAGAAIAALGPFRVNAFGHLGDGNLHYNVFAPKGKTRDNYPGSKEKIRETVYEMVHEYGGSFSAEHGIGRLKVAELQRFADPAKLAAMRAVKTALDPTGIMNPGVIFG